MNKKEMSQVIAVLKNIQEKTAADPALAAKFNDLVKAKVEVPKLEVLDTGKQEDNDVEDIKDPENPNKDKVAMGFKLVRNPAKSKDTTEMLKDEMDKNAPAPAVMPKPSKKPTLKPKPTVKPEPMYHSAWDMHKADYLSKDNEPHADNSPQDIAHDVVEEGRDLGTELKHNSPERDAKILEHLRMLHGHSQLRDPQNQQAGMGAWEASKAHHMSKCSTGMMKSEKKAKTTAEHEKEARDRASRIARHEVENNLPPRREQTKEQRKSPKKAVAKAELGKGDVVSIKTGKKISDDSKVGTTENAHLVADQVMNDKSDKVSEKLIAEKNTQKPTKIRARKKKAAANE